METEIALEPKSQPSSSLPLNKLAQQLIHKIENKTVHIGVIGLGYVGLPFLVEKAKVGLRVTGLDNNKKRLESLKKKKSYIYDVPDETLQEILTSKVNISNDFDELASCDVLVICVPTPLDKNLCPDLQYVVKVTQALAQRLRPGQLISLESTTYPGTTEDIIRPILEDTGLKCGEDFFLAHSPERVDPGNKRYSTKNTNKIIGADDPDSLAVAMAFYQLAIEKVVAVSSSKTAEMVKVYENTFRAINIALANETALLCNRMGIDVWEMLDAAFTKPFGIMPFYPGPGVGGHCIPVDPHYLEWKAKEYNFNARFITLAGDINRRMPLFVFNRIATILNDYKKSINGARIIMLGLAYKADLPDYRESPALEIWHLLHKAGAEIDYHDQYVPSIEIDGKEISSVALKMDQLKTYDLVLITTAHSGINYQHVVQHAKCIFDTRNVTKGIKNDKVVKL